jgi:hypothetical protein
VANPGNAFGGSSLSITYVEHGELKLVLAPMPVKRGQPLCLYPSEPLAQSRWTFFGSDQQLVGRLSSDGGQACFSETAGLATGSYIVRVWVRSVAGVEKTFIKQVVVQ